MSPFRKIIVWLKVRPDSSVALVLALLIFLLILVGAVGFFASLESAD